MPHCQRRRWIHTAPSTPGQTLTARQCSCNEFPTKRLSTRHCSLFNSPDKREVCWPKEKSRPDSLSPAVWCANRKHRCCKGSPDALRKGFQLETTAHCYNHDPILGKGAPERKKKHKLMQRAKSSSGEQSAETSILLGRRPHAQPPYRSHTAHAY